jgi:uncharacterized protein DUF1571
MKLTKFCTSLASFWLLCSLAIHANAVEPSAGPASAPHRDRLERGENTDGRESLPNTLATPSDDPQDYLERALTNYEARISSYKCRFFKKEYANGKMKKRQGISVLFREDPLSVQMTWFQNAGRIRKATYVKGKYVDKNGNDCVLVEPSSAAVRLFVPELKIPVHGKRATKAGPYTMDQFGFRAMLERMVETNRIAAGRGELGLRLVAEAEYDGRPTYVFERKLPYTGDGSDYPEALLVIHMDREWEVPLAAFSYSDAKRRHLLSSYELQSVEINPDLTDRAFGMSSR